MVGVRSGHASGRDPSRTAADSSAYLTGWIDKLDGVAPPVYAEEIDN